MCRAPPRGRPRGRAGGRRPRSAGRARGAARAHAAAECRSRVVVVVTVEGAGGAAATRRRASGPSGEAPTSPSSGRRAAQIDVPIGPCAARVGRGAQLAEQAQLDERRLELRSGLPPLDSSSAASAASTAGRWRLPVKYDRNRARRCGRARRRAAARAGRETGTHPASWARLRRDGASCAAGGRAAPTARRGRRRCVRRAPARARSGASSTSAVANASGRARWQGASPHRGSARAREADAFVRSSSSRRASHTVSTTDAATRRPEIRSTSRSRNARSKRALCATRTPPSAKARKRRTASSARGAPRSAAGWMPVSAVRAGAGALRDRRASRTSRPARGSARAARRSRRSVTCRGASPVVSRSKTTKSPRRAGRWLPVSASPTDAAAPGKARVAGDDIVEQRPGDRRGGGGEREQHPRGLVGRQRPTSGLDQLDEPVGGIEAELHHRQPRRTYVRHQVPRRAETAAAKAAARGLTPVGSEALSGEAAEVARG